ncbi:phosphohistidine phosphatase [Roseibium hamelinense]|uniref:Phosphohistidine phosphatase n=1 Tax=Roseibium hamelinense TaxID=150831 RepID=A0A562TBJ3_9HYPH|nr:histidine phosphatase family protein [Roseibium hamelinense]MTI45272.1 histidine phosphatase family protein [Roseibium hamelinense]TWI90366.1 phosphohistidine phosphatase [Roseibium hamelinense]
MLELMLLRHAKSDWNDASLKDTDRPLNSRGRSSARIMAAYLHSHSLHPDLILCSSAQRTRETLSRLTNVFQHDFDIVIRKELYDQHMNGSYTSFIRAEGGAAKRVMVLAHNPATEETASELFGTGDEALQTELQTKFPTAALAVFEFPIDTWKHLQPGTGTLTRFVKPRDLLAEPDAEGHD